MKNTPKSTLIILAGIMLFGCSNHLAMKSQTLYEPESQAAYSKREVPKEKKFSFDNAEVVGYLDSPSPVYATESEDLYEATAEKPSSAGHQDLELEQLKQQLDKEINFQQAATQVQGKSIQKRMVAYVGFISSRSTKPDSLIANAVAMAESLKGYVELRNNSSVTLRIPIAKFDNLYDSLLKMGEVINYQKSAEDISDAFRDTDLRVKVLEKTIERYVKLIQLVKEDKDKITLLKEIERLREELEALRVQKSVLALRAEFAKIIYSVVQVSTGFSGINDIDKIQGFEWMSSLDPLKPLSFGKMLQLNVPDGMVKLKDRNFWISQSPAGSRIWTALVPNKPMGTTDFWIDAIAFKMREQFQSVDTDSFPGYRFIRCIPQPDVNYRYYVGVKVVGKSVQIIQCFFPDGVQENRYLESVKKMLAERGA